PGEALHPRREKNPPLGGSASFLTLPRRGRPVPALETRALGSTIAADPDSAGSPAGGRAHAPRPVGEPLAEPAPGGRSRRPAPVAALLRPPGRPGPVATHGRAPAAADPPDLGE